MTSSSAMRKWEPKPLQILSVLLILQLFVTLFTDGFALSFDEAMWHYIGRNWFRNGLAPYTGGIDNKSPLIFAIFGLSDKLFGVNYWFPRVLGTICQSIGIYYVFKIAKHINGERAGILAMTLYGLSLLWHTTGGKYVSYTETYEVLFTVLAVYRFLVAKSSRDIFVCGLLAGIAFCFRLTGAFGALAILIFCLRENRKYALFFCLGVFVSIASLLLCGLIAGISLHDMLTYGLLDNFSSGSATDHTFLWKWHNFSAKFLLSGMVLFYPMVAGYLFIKRKFDLFVLWLVLEFTGICLIGIFDYVHVKQVLAPLTVMSALCIDQFIGRYKISANLALLVIFIIFFPNISEQSGNVGKAIFSLKEPKRGFCVPPYTIPDEGTRKRLGWYIKDNTATIDKVYIAGFGAQAQAYSERISPTVYFNATQTPTAKARLFTDLRSNQPQMILVPLFPEYKQTVSADMRDFVDSLVAKNYKPAGCVYNYEVFNIMH
ncbi:MAG: glycosyltransferase family 39 protein [Bacteroidetes bacterium]|nr:glycosyltransferase family 39 protein [Bacteroidota bacterium]